MDRFARRAVRLRWGGAIAALAALAGCGGGGGGGVISAPAPAPTPTPSPTPAPSPTPSPTPTPASSFNTAEYRRSDGPAFHNAVTAWQSGITGTGSTIAIVDTGIDTDSPEFAGRISSASTDVAGSRTVDGEDDHGTDVALIAAAARDNQGIVGIAYTATILALRADSPGSCASAANGGDGCQFDDRDIASGIDRAVEQHATVINLSLGGGAPGNRMIQAVQRAAAAGVVIIVSAGNDGDSTDSGIDPSQPDPFASGILGAGRANVIIVGSVDDRGNFSSFSNRAGSDAASFLSARGEDICCAYENGSLKITTDPDGTQYVTLFSGTSFSAPQVAGAVALLKQAFPNLTGADLVSILLDSARDAGATGTDAIYGRGILDIARAFAPQGTTTLAGSGTSVAPADDTGVASGPMGDAFTNVPLATILTDKYDRAYDYDLGRGLHGASLQPRLLGVIESSGNRVALTRGRLAMAFTIGEGGRAGGLRWERQLQLTPEDAEAARVLAARVAVKLAPEAELGFAISESAQGLTAQLQGQDRPAFLIATDAAGDVGFLRTGDAAIAFRRRFGGWGVTVSAESGQAWLGNRRLAEDYKGRLRERYPTRSFGVALDRSFGPVEATLGLTWLQEDRTILGAYFHDMLGASGAHTLFADASAGYRFADRWRLGASARQGFTRADRTGLVAAGSNFTTRAWSLDLTRQGAFQPGDSLGFRLSQPLRVARGQLNLELPVSYDYATESPIYGVRTLPLAPNGCELMSELAWQGSLWDGAAAASVFLRRDPGNYADAPNDAGVALKWSKRF